MDFLRSNNEAHVVNTQYKHGSVDMKLQLMFTLVVVSNINLFKKKTVCKMCEKKNYFDSMSYFKFIVYSGLLQFLR